MSYVRLENGLIITLSSAGWLRSRLIQSASKMELVFQVISTYQNLRMQKSIQRLRKSFYSRSQVDGCKNALCVSLTPG